MRLLHVHSGNLYGGVETLLHTLARERDLCPEMRPEFALCFDSRIAAELRQTGTVVHILGDVRVRNPVQLAKARRRLMQTLSKGAFDAVICHMAWPLAVFGVAARRSKVPLIFWMHDAVIQRNWLVLWAALNPPDLIICNSRFTASTVRRMFKCVPFETLYYPVARRTAKLNSAQRERVRNGLKTASEAVVLMQSSRMEHWKGHTLLLDALAQIADIPQWVCWIAGGPQRPQEVSYERALRARASGLGLNGRVLFLGQRSDVPLLLGAADIFCQPNLRAEPFGIAFIEAMQAALPVVTTASGGPLEIIEGDCGALVEGNDAVSLAPVLRELIEDKGLRRILGSAASHRASQLCDPGRQLRLLHSTIRRISTSGDPHSQGN
jgi:glycosyltransferase involved in cell wall biosynthesis